MKKKLAVLLMAGLLGVTLAACGGSKEQKKELETTGNESKSEEKIPLKISHHPYLHALPVSMQRIMDSTMNSTIPLICMREVLSRTKLLHQGPGKLVLQESAERSWVSFL